MALKDHIPLDTEELGRGIPVHLDNDKDRAAAVTEAIRKEYFSILIGK